MISAVWRFPIRNASFLFSRREGILMCMPSAAAVWSRRYRVLSVLSMNAVPLVGVLYARWPPANILVLFWAETLIGGIANVVRIAVHRRLTHLAGHYRVQVSASATLNGRPVGNGSYLAQFCTMMFPFTIAHGIFLGVFLLILRENAVGGSSVPWTIDLLSLKRAVVLIALIAITELLLDLPSIASQTFAWIKVRSGQFVGRVLILHLGIIFGFLLVSHFKTPVAFLALLIAMKTLLELAQAVSPATSAKDMPDEAPGWFRSMFNKSDLDVAKEWKDLVTKTRNEEIEDEKPVPAGQLVRRSRKRGNRNPRATAGAD